MLIHNPNKENVNKDFIIISEAIKRMAVNPTATEIMLINDIANQLANLQKLTQSNENETLPMH